MTAQKTWSGMTFSLLHLCQIQTFEEWHEKKRERAAARATVTLKVRDPATPGPERMHLRCEYTLKYGRTMYSCPKCWLQPGICVCGFIAPTPTKTQLVVHVHQTEWGRCSNTGCVAALSVPGSQLLLKGHREHDAQLQALFQDPTITTAILWPGERSILPSELKAIADEKTNGRIAVVAVDATWDGAMRMKCSYPADAIHVRLPPETALGAPGGRSLLHPARKYRGDLENNGRVSTLEAIAALLGELEGDEGVRDKMLHNLKIKVDAMMVQKNVPTVYDTIGATLAEKVRVESAIIAERVIKEYEAKGLDMLALEKQLQAMKDDEDDD